jgi:predicted RNA-binding Zn-ribbon protein involved in translation (DUF1610 family)
MIDYKLAIRHSNSVPRQDCPECGARMRLFGIEADQPLHELLSFDCPECRHVETKIRRSDVP